MKNDFNANYLLRRWPVVMVLVFLLIACSLCDPNCDPDDPNNLFCIASGEELNIKQTQQAETEAAYPGSEDEKVDSRYLELKAEADRINNAIFELGGQNKPIPVSMENRLNEIEREMKEWRNWKKYHNQPTPIPAGTMEPEPMQAPTLQAQSPDNPPALYADQPVDICKKVKPSLINIQGDFCGLGGFGSKYKCEEGCGRININVWNVGAMCGSQYAQVECQQLDVPVFAHVVTYDECQMGDFRNDYGIYWCNQCGVPLTFTGGPNGSVMCGDGVVIVQLKDNGYKAGIKGWNDILDPNAPFLGEVVVSDPSLFAGIP